MVEICNSDTAAIRFSTRFRGELPGLRRLARAIVGEQRLADFCVVQLMEDLLSDTGLISGRTEFRVAFYNRLLKIINYPPSMYSEFQTCGSQTPRSRQTQLLTAVAGFSVPHVAEVLEVSTTEIEALLADAHHDILQQAGARVLIIEDEPFISMQLEMIVRKLGHKVVGVAMTRDQALCEERTHIPDLILSDVYLADGSSGIEAVQDILLERSVPVIFITAYPERFLTGKCEEPAFLITKPFECRAVNATISQALFNSRQRIDEASRANGLYREDTIGS